MASTEALVTPQRFWWQHRGSGGSTAVPPAVPCSRDVPLAQLLCISWAVPGHQSPALLWECWEGSSAAAVLSGDTQQAPKLSVTSASPAPATHSFTKLLFPSAHI